MTWTKGMSGNPKGRPRTGATVTEWLRYELRRVAAEDGKTTAAQQLATLLVRLSLDGDVAAAKTVLAYTDGLPRPAVEHDASGVLASVEWRGVRTAVLAALAGHPEARAAVAEALLALEVAHAASG